MLDAFQPQGNSVIIAVSTTPTTGIIVSTGGCMGYRVANVGAALCYVTFAGSAVTCTLPTSAAPAPAIPIFYGTAEAFNLAPNTFFSAMCSSAAGATTLVITPGFGV